MKRAAVIGRPIAHSLSPLIHSAWIDALQLDATYEALEPKGDNFEGLVLRLFEVGYVGFNVTAPYKKRASTLADEPSDVALRFGNANVLTQQNFDGFDLIQADNTDGVGLVAALTAQKSLTEYNEESAVVLGAGDASETAAIQLASQGLRVTVINRTADRARALAERTGVKWAPWELLPNVLEQAALIVNATSAVHEGTPLFVPLERATNDPVVLEMSYRPLRTPLLQQAENLGLRAIDGLAMLIGQARPSFEAFFGVAPPPPEVVDVRALCLRALGETA